MDQGGGGMLGGGGRGASQRSGAAAKPVKKLTISLKKGESHGGHRGIEGLHRKAVGRNLRADWSSPPTSLTNCPIPIADKPQLPENFEDETWQKLKDCVRAVHMQQPVNQSFEQLYKVPPPSPRCHIYPLFDSRQKR